jgi:hypothetical protein
MVTKIDLYLDLDGVILRRTGGVEFKGQTEFALASNAMDFLSWSIDHFNCFWLTSRSHDGAHDEIERAFRFAMQTTKIPAEILKLIRIIRPAIWGKAKIEGINKSREFFWVDDNPDKESLRTLEQEGLKGRWIEVSTDRCPDDLVRLQTLLEKTNLLNNRS